MKSEFESDYNHVNVILFGILYISCLLLLFSSGLFLVLTPIWFLLLGVSYIWLIFKHRYQMTSREKIGYASMGLFYIGIFIISGPLVIWPLEIEIITTGVIPIWNFPPEAAISLNLLYSFFVALLFLAAAVIILIKNSRSSITRIFFLSFVCIAIAWCFYIYYIALSWDLLPEQVQMIYLVFYCMLFLGVVVLAHSCEALTTTDTIFFHKSIYIILSIHFVISILLMTTQQNHLLVGVREQFYWIREHSFLYSIFYTLSLLIPIGYSLYSLSYLPDWMTEGRRQWIKRVRFGIGLLILYPIGEAVTGLVSIVFLQEPLLPGIFLTRGTFILVISIMIFAISPLIIISSTPKVTKWFFEEVKIRATPTLREINPNVNLAAIWEQVDEWEKENELTPKKMTNQKLEEYVQAAKSLL